MAISPRRRSARADLPAPALALRRRQAGRRISTARPSPPRYGFETVTIRYFNVFGPRQDPNSQYSAVIPLFITAMLAGRQPTIYGDGGQSRDFTYIANVVHGNLLAADAPNVAGRVFNVANGRNTTLLELIAALNRLLGTNIEPIHAPPRVGDVRESLADITRPGRTLAYEPQVDFEDGPAPLDRLLSLDRSAADGPLKNGTGSDRSTPSADRAGRRGACPNFSTRQR